MVELACLENKCGASYRGFESLSLRHENYAHLGVIFMFGLYLTSVYLPIARHSIPHKTHRDIAAYSHDVSER